MKAQASLRGCVGSLARAFAVRTHEVWKQTMYPKNPTSSPHWMVAHARSKNEFSEDEKYQKLMRLRICDFTFWYASSCCQRRAEIFDCGKPWRALSRLMRLWYLSPSVNSFFKRAYAAIHWGYTSDFWSDSSSTFIHMCEQRRLWRDCASLAEAQSRQCLRCSPMR